MTDREYYLERHRCKVHIKACKERLSWLALAWLEDGDYSDSATEYGLVAEDLHMWEERKRRVDEETRRRRVRETPLKPYKLNTDGYVDDVELYGFCPECHYDFNFDNSWIFGRPPDNIADRFPRCPECGQRIDWTLSPLDEDGGGVVE